MNLDSLRAMIDRVDDDILDAVARRLDLVRLAPAFKREVVDERRERNLKERLKAVSSGILDGAFVERLWECLIEEARKAQAVGKALVGYRGIRGSAVERAAAAWNPDARPLPFGADIQALLEAVRAGAIEAGAIGADGGLASFVHALFDEGRDASKRRSVSVLAAVDVNEPCCMLALPGAREPTEAWADAATLDRCREALSSLGLASKVFPDGATAARTIAREGISNAIALAGRRAASLYGLSVVRDDLGDSAGGTVRCFVVGHATPAGGTPRFAVAFRGAGRETEADSSRLPGADGAKRVFKATFPADDGRPVSFVEFEGSDADRESVMKALEAGGRAPVLAGCYGVIVDRDHGSEPA